LNKLKDSASMRGAYSKRLGEPEAGKVRGEIFVFGRIDFVNHEKHALVPATEPLCKFQIQRRGTMLTVDYEEEQIGALDGDLRGGVRLLGKVWIRARTNAARVDYLEWDAAESADRHDTIASYAGLIMNDGNLPTCETIE
jgi:hypothetical protein